VGFLTVLLSPIAWLHHLVWFVPAILVLVGDGRSRLRVGLAAGAWFVIDAPLELPWRGARWLVGGGEPVAVARLAQNSFPLLVVLLMLAIHASLLRPRSPRGRARGGPPNVTAGATDHAAVTTQGAPPAPDHDEVWDTPTGDRRAASVEPRR
jgi:hypothetical protein